MLRTVRLLLTAALLFMAPLQAALAGERIVSKALGFEITLPDSWVILTQDQILSNYDRTSSLKDEIEESLKGRKRQLPLLVAARFEEPYPDINPNIQIRYMPYATGQSRNIRRIADEVSKKIKQLARNATQVDPAELVDLDGLQVAHTKIQVTLKSSTGELPVVSEAWYIPKSEFYLVVTTGYRPDGLTGTRDAGAAAILSMKIAREEL